MNANTPMPPTVAPTMMPMGGGDDRAVELLVADGMTVKVTETDEDDWMEGIGDPDSEIVGVDGLTVINIVDGEDVIVADEVEKEDSEDDRSGRTSEDVEDLTDTVLAVVEVMAVVIISGNFDVIVGVTATGSSWSSGTVYMT